MPKLKAPKATPAPATPAEPEQDVWRGQYHDFIGDIHGSWQERPQMGMTVLAVDPGDERVGVCVGQVAAGQAWVIGTSIATPRDFRGWFRSGIGCFDLVTCERWALRADMAKTLIGSEMLSSQLIGWLRMTIEDWNEEYTKRPEFPAHGYAEIQWESNPSTILNGTAGVMMHSKIPQVSPGKRLDTKAHTNDAFSAELHWWYTVIKNGFVDGLSIANPPKKG